MSVSEEEKKEKVYLCCCSHFFFNYPSFYLFYFPSLFLNFLSLSLSFSFLSFPPFFSLFLFSFVEFHEKKGFGLTFNYIRIPPASSPPSLFSSLLLFLLTTFLLGHFNLFHSSDNATTLHCFFLPFFPLFFSSLSRILRDGICGWRKRWTDEKVLRI